jgi:hypothetical protein
VKLSKKKKCRLLFSICHSSLMTLLTTVDVVPKGILVFVEKNGNFYYAILEKLIIFVVISKVLVLNFQIFFAFIAKPDII